MIELVSPERRKQVRVVGLVGGVASGKSVVARLLVERGAVWLDADRAGHDVLAEPEVIDVLRRAWGDGMLDEAGHLIPARIAERVFAPTPAGRADLALLEATTHPRIATRLQRQADDAIRAGARVLVLDAPLLMRAGWIDACDRVVFVDAPDEQRQSRALARGWSAPMWRSREDAQEPLDQKRLRSHVTINNSGSIDETRRQIEQLWPDLLPGAVE